MKPNVSVQIEFIKDCLRNGEQRESILEKFGKKWNLKRATIDNRLKIAKKAMQGDLKAIEEQTKVSTQKEIEARKSKIATVLDRLEILTKIMNGKSTEDNPISMQDRIRAIAELNKMAGDYAPFQANVDGGLQINITRKII